MKMLDGVRTYSPVKAFMMTTFGGHRVRAIHREPIFALSGVVLYDTSWTLVPVEGN